MSRQDRDQTPPPEGGFPATLPPDRGGVAIGVFGKHWTPGATKTRLARSIGAAAAAEVSKQFLETTLRRLDGLGENGTSLLLAFSPRERVKEVEKLAARIAGDWQTQPQADGDLGQRMHDFLADSLAGHRAAVLVGSDSPHLPLNAVGEALDWLAEPRAGRRFVLGPTTDGGYWLIGASGELPPVFDEMPWSDPDLFRATRDRLEASGWREGTDYRILPGWYDVDEASDLVRLRTELPAGDAELVRLAASLDNLLGPWPPAD